MKDKRSHYLKVQEHADRFATTNPLEEMAAIEKDADKDDAALKWLALAVFHGVNANANKITLTRTGEKGKTQLALGIRDSSLEIQVKVKKDGDGEKVTLRFPL